MSHLEWKCFFAAAGEHAPSRPVGLSSWIPRINFVSVFSIVWVFSGLIIAGYQFADIKTTNLTCDGDIATSIRTPINVALGAIVVCSFDFVRISCFYVDLLTGICMERLCCYSFVLHGRSREEKAVAD